MKSYKCSHVGCTTVGIALVMFARSNEEIISFTGNSPVTLSDLDEHALCSKHAHSARASGKRVYKLSETIKSLIERSEQKAVRSTGPDNSTVGRGLGGLAKRDAAKHPEKNRASKPQSTKCNPALALKQAEDTKRYITRSR